MSRMTVVKGSKIKRVKVVVYQLRTVIILAALPIVMIIGVGFAAYFHGHDIGMAGQQQALADVARLSDELELQTRRAEELDQQLANSTMAAQVDRQSSEDVRQEVISLKDEIARLAEENTFYRGLMAPNKDASGLTLGALELFSGRSSDVYNYKVVVKQLAKRHNLLSGRLKFTVIGRQDGVETRLPLMQLSTSVKSEVIKLRFKYFQVIEGELTLPEGFEPEGIEIEASTTGKKPQKSTKKFGWLVEER